MAGIKSLAKDSMIYGGSTIVTKFISWLMTPLFSYFILKSEFGMMTTIYAYGAVIIVVLTFGMETGFFRFVNQSPPEKKDSVYSTALLIVGSLIIAFLLVFLGFLRPIRFFLFDASIPDSYLRLILILACLDTFNSLPFAFLRYEKRPLRFGFYKVLQVTIYALLCVFFLVLCPKINNRHPEWISWFWKTDFRVGYILIANLIATGIQALCLLLQMKRFRISFDRQLAQQLFSYCFPLMLMGLAGMSNQVVDKIIFPAIYPDRELTFDQLGVYSACFKIGVIMIMFTQAFRYAFDPYVFEKKKDADAKQSYSTVMKYFVALGLLVFLAVVFYLDIFKYFVASAYWSALKIVPIVLIGELFFAVYYNLSIWYKLTDKTYWGTIFSVLGFVIIVVINVLFIPNYSYMACAWASFAGNFFIMLISYFIGQKYYPIKYDLKAIGLYAGLAMALFLVAESVVIENMWLRLLLRTVLLGVYAATALLLILRGRKVKPGNT
ncbi:MAG: oligosaccharide flippase family protein [Dysgonamonadaceae bacterium]|jgi:O-antigen/teichoic acid export membrane protein|nr:oligosaccharide flippase family protein [Dysgonamonadaceae bacterium]